MVSSGKMLTVTDSPEEFFKTTFITLVAISILHL
jgi:hypothetical protein